MVFAPEARHLRLKLKLKPKLKLGPVSGMRQAPGVDR
jgi:hypothetical protein